MKSIPKIAAARLPGEVASSMAILKYSDTLPQIHPYLTQPVTIEKPSAAMMLNSA